MSYIQIKKTFLEELHSLKKVEKYLKQISHQKKLYGFSTTRFLKNEGKNDGLAFRFYIDDGVEPNDSRLSNLTSRQKGRLTINRFYDSPCYIDTAYELFCIKTNKGICLKITNACTGPSLAFANIYFSEIASYMLLMYCRQFKLDILNFHSIYNIRGK